MRLTLFEILFGAIVVVLAFLPIIFLVYLKHHSEVLKNFELRRNRQTFRYKFFLILLGISISGYFYFCFLLFSFHINFRNAIFPSISSFSSRNIAFRMGNVSSM